ncbi:MAG: FAD-binding domain-containing protein [Planctomycetota bacterium]
MSAPPVVWWVKRDARLADNACLAHAAERGLAVLPVHCVEPSLMSADDHSAMHAQASWQAVTALRGSLRARGADILIAHGEVAGKLAKLRSALPFTAVLSHEEVGNGLTYRRDLEVAAWCRANGVKYLEFPQRGVRRGGINRDRFRRFFMSRVASSPPLEIPEIRTCARARALASATGFPALPAFADNPGWQPVSEAAARATLEDFLGRRGLGYRGGISSPNTALEAGSRLSAHLAWGTLTARQAWHAVKARLAGLDPRDPDTPRWRRSLAAFLSRLAWRDHFTQRLESEPDLEFRSPHPSYRDIPYENDPRLLGAWVAGLTGFPLVDAVMRCLAATGFVNFRMRAMAVSLACHVLHLDWRAIHPHLARVFRDYDPGIHLPQVQMQAGVVGWNAIRVYNPSKQLAEQDPKCQFTRRWLPELADVETSRILKGDIPGGYPAPVAAFAPRSRAMAAVLYGIRKTREARAETPGVYARHGSRKPEQAFRPRRRKPEKPPERTLFDDLGE